MNAVETIELPRIFDYPCFAAFLADYIDRRRRTQAWFSARWIAKRAGIASPAQISMLMSRKRDPSLAVVEQVCAALSLSAEDTHYAVLLTERELDRSPVLVDLVARELGALAAANGWPAPRPLPLRAPLLAGRVSQSVPQ